MQSNNRLLDDIARLANGAMGVAAGFRSEVEGMIKARLTAMLAEGNLVPREDFEVVREMAAKARAEQEMLQAKVATLEARLAALEAKFTPANRTGIPEPVLPENRF
jgi:BMFP domain-containing protein YqiC